MSLNHEHNRTPGGGAMIRRDFLARSGAWAASPLFLRSLDLFGGTQGERDVCAAYWRGSDAPGNVLSFLAADEEDNRETPPMGQADDPCDLIPAQAAGRGDARLGDERAAVSIQGVIPSPVGEAGASNKLYSVSVQVDFRPFHDAAFYAWQYDCRYVSNISSRSRFTMPVDRDYGLNLSLELLEANSGREPARRTLPIRLGLDGANRSLPLRRGVYFFAWPNPHGGWRPDWRDVQVQRIAGGGDENSIVYYRLLRRQGAAGIKFPYVTISLDYAGAVDCV